MGGLPMRAAAVGLDGGGGNPPWDGGGPWWGGGPGGGPPPCLMWCETGGMLYELCLGGGGGSPLWRGIPEEAAVDTTVNSW